MNTQNQIANNFVSNDSNIASTIGNSWIICKSKSYPGRVYFFNTISGEAAWNLSVAEMEKAKRTTLESEHNIKHTDFPEPLEIPQDIVCNQNPNARTIVHNITPSRVYNKQIINNKFSRPVNPNPNSSFTYSPFNNINPLNFGLPAFAPLMNVPANSIILAPQTLQQNVDTNYNPMHKNQTFNNTSSPVPSGFPNSQDNPATRAPFHLNTLNNRNIFQNNSSPKRTIDLRQKLLNIRNKNQHTTEVKRPGENGPILFRNTVPDVHDTALEEHYINGANNIEEPDLTNDFTEELIEELHIDTLKKEFGIINTNECWFIVADEDVLVNYTNFIIKLLESDDQCRLVIPQVVIVQIQRSTTSIKNKESLQAASFISEALESNVAIIDEDDSYGSEDHYENIINCCLKLVNQNCAVVFISVRDMPNNNCGLPMFTIKDIKKLLINTKLKDGLSITITIPNVSEEDNALNNKLVDCNIDGEIGRNDRGIPIPIFFKEISVQTENITTTVDVAIQADCTPDKNNVNQTNKNVRGKNTIWLRRKPPGTNVTSKTMNITDNINLVPKPKVQDAATNTTIESNRNVMFHILNKTMDDYLRVKSDEWVSRFVQIMEEAVTQILQQDSSFVADMPPPWTIYEASECVKRKFSYDSDVMDAATKLSDVLFQIGGLRGKINNNMDPETYMKMYSYGYYLIDALQNVILNNEDLQIAGTSLSKLLSDIQNPHLDPSNSDSFTDIDSTRNNDSDIYINKFPQNDQVKDHLPKSIVAESESMSEDNNIDGTVLTKVDSNVLRSKETISITNNASHENKTDVPSMSQIFRESKNIHLKEKVIPKGSPTKKYNLRNSIKFQNNEKDSNEIILKHLSPKDSFLTNFDLKFNNNNNGKNVEDGEILNADNGHTFDDRPGEGPKIMRNFTVCPEFEKRLKEQSVNLSKEISEDQKLDYECLDESVASETEDLAESDKEIDSTPTDLEEEAHLKQSKSFRHFLDEIGTKVKESFITVYYFCENSRNKLLTSVDDQQRLQIRIKAVKMGIFVDNMCSSLKRILDRESSDSQEGAREILLKMGFRDKDIDEIELEYYRSFISKCIVQGEILQQSMKLLIEAVGET